MISDKEGLSTRRYLSDVGSRSQLETDRKIWEEAIKLSEDENELIEHLRIHKNIDVVAKILNITKLQATALYRSAVAKIREQKQRESHLAESKEIISKFKPKMGAPSRTDRLKYEEELRKFDESLDIKPKVS